VTYSGARVRAEQRSDGAEAEPSPARGAEAPLDAFGAAVVAALGRFEAGARFDVDVGGTTRRFLAAGASSGEFD
jgi:hypothetical protein